MEKKVNSFLSSLKNFDAETDSNKVLLLSFFWIEILKKSEVDTKKLKQLYENAGVPYPQNYGGEIKNLLRSKRFIKTKGGYKLSRSAKEWVISKANAKTYIKRPKGQISLSFNVLHPLIRKVSKSLFDDSHYSQATFEAYKAVVNEVKNVSGVKNMDGKPLMERVFYVNNPIIKFNNLQTQSDQDEQVGLMLLFSGATLGIRNPKAHDNIVQTDPIRALEYLSFASLLLKRLDERVQ